MEGHWNGGHLWCCCLCFKLLRPCMESPNASCQLHESTAAMCAYLCMSGAREPPCSGASGAVTVFNPKLLHVGPSATHQTSLTVHRFRVGGRVQRARAAFPEIKLQEGARLRLWWWLTGVAAVRDWWVVIITSSWTAAQDWTLVTSLGHWDAVCVEGWGATASISAGGGRNVQCGVGRTAGPALP